MALSPAAPIPVSISANATSKQFDRHRNRQMRCSRMLIDDRCCLSAAVAVGATEIEGGDAMFAEGALERSAAVQLFGCVISHVSIVGLLAVPVPGNGCATLE